MSVRTGLTLIGTVVGAYFGNPQLGYAIGSLVGNAVDPVQIQGPQLGDIPPQTSRDGVPRPVVYGVGVVSGNLVAVGNVRKVERHESQAKGGPETVTERALLTYAIRICEGPIKGISRIWQDEKLVYDVSAAAPVYEDNTEFQRLFLRLTHTLAGTAKFLGNKRIYLGDESQMPDAALEAIFGVGDTPAFRGSAYMVFEDEDITDAGVRVPSYRFEVVNDGTPAASATLSRFEANRYSGFRQAHWPLLDDESNYTLVGSRFSTDFSSASGITGATVDDIINDPAVDIYGTGAPAQYLGYASRSETIYGFDRTTETYDPTDVDTIYLLYNQPEATPIAAYLTTAAYGSGTICGATSIGVWKCDKQGALVTKATQVGFVYSGPYETFQDCSATEAVVGCYPLVIAVTRKRFCDDGSGADYARPRLGRVAVRMPEDGEFLFDFDSGDVLPPETASTASGTWKGLTAEATTSNTWGVSYDAYDVGPVLKSTDARYSDSAFWTAAYDAAVDAGTLPAGWTYGVEYPQVLASGHVCQHDATFNQVTNNGLYLYQIVDDLCERVGITSDLRDTSALTDLVTGYVVGRQMSAADAIRGLQPAYFFDSPEYDAKIRFTKRGGTSVATLDADDLVYTDGSAVRLVRDQAVEYPRKVHCISYDRTTGYVPTKQTAERRTNDVRALSEMTLSVALVLSSSERAQIADKAMKVAWADAEGTLTLSLPEALSYLVPADVIHFGAKRYRIDSIEAFDGYFTAVCRNDRQSAYTSDLEALDPTDPSTPPTTPTGGPTLLSVLNIAAREEDDERSGVYVAVAGVLSGWGGAVVKMSVDDGATWPTVATITVPTAQGYLSAPLAAGDVACAVRVFGDALDAATTAQVALGANRIALSSDDGQTWEIASFEGATVGADEHDYALDTMTRGLDDTTAADYGTGDFVCALENLVFVPIDASLDGATIQFKAITDGTSEDNAYVETIVFHVQDVIWDGGGA